MVVVHTYLQNRHHIEPQEVKAEEEVEDKSKVSDKSPLIPIDDLVTALRTYMNPSLKLGNIG